MRYESSGLAVSMVVRDMGGGVLKVVRFEEARIPVLLNEDHGFHALSEGLADLVSVAWLRFGEGRPERWVGDVRADSDGSIVVLAWPAVCARRWAMTRAWCDFYRRLRDDLDYGSLRGFALGATGTVYYALSWSWVL